LVTIRAGRAPFKGIPEAIADRSQLCPALPFGFERDKRSLQGMFI
jgi:hypothetical protein